MDRQKRSESTQADEFIGVLSVRNASLDYQEPLKGTFVKGRSGLCFELSEKHGGQEIKLPLWKSSDPEARAKYEPLFSFLEEKKLSVVLYGRHLRKHEVYAIYTLELNEENRSPFSPSAQFSPDFLRTVVERLKISNVCSSSQDLCESEASFNKPEELRAYYAICKSMFPAWVSRAIRKDLNRLSSFGSSSDSVKHAQKALRYLFTINWEKPKLKVLSVEEARETLDKMFYGLEEVKSRILEIVAQINHTGELPLWGVLLNGPAGTGKTSIAKAVAKLLGMPVIPIDASSIGNEAEELAGSSRIYSNAQPGIILEKMMQAKSSSGLLLINEIDKATTQGREGARGSADTLLTLLDRQGFYENFLEESIPTDGLFAMATCNDITKISKPLRDRFLVINIPGYSSEEKTVIWKDYVLPKVMDRLRLKREQLNFTPEAADELIRNYAVEPGARDLEKYSERFADALCPMLNKNGDDYCHTFTLEEVRKLLGPGRTVRRTFAMNPGEINAAFSFQGTAHFFLIEAAITAGRGKLRVLGPVPGLQREYIRAAYECIRNTAACDLSDKDVTVFVPQPLPETEENLVGCAAYAAIFSLIMHTELEIRDIAFLGGVDLNGNLYFDSTDIRPLLKAVKEAKIKTLYVPLGVSELVRQFAGEEDAITVVEAHNAELLLAMAMTANRHK